MERTDAAAAVKIAARAVKVLRRCIFVDLGTGEEVERNWYGRA